MTSFSDILSVYIKERKTNISALSAETGIERTLLHKYISGKRTPSDIRSVILISDGLMLSPDEKETLCESYKIVSMGEECYQRCKKAKKICDFLSDLPDPDIFRSTSASEPLISSVMKDKLSVEMTIRRIISDSSTEKIFVISPPSYSVTSAELIAACINRPEIQVTHILTFSSVCINFNLDIFENILPLLVFCEGYTPLINYRTSAERENSAVLMPNLILTEKYAFNFSSGCDKGILHTRNDISELYHSAAEFISERSYGFIDKKISSAPAGTDDIFKINDNFYIERADKSVSLIYRTGSFWSRILIYEQSLRKVFDEFVTNMLTSK